MMQLINRSTPQPPASEAVLVANPAPEQPSTPQTPTSETGLPENLAPEQPSRKKSIPRIGLIIVLTLGGVALSFLVLLAIATMLLSLIVGPICGKTSPEIFAQNPASRTSPS